MATVKKTIKKAQKGVTQGMTMRQLIKKYPGTDTTAQGDTRFEEYNAYSPKSFIKQLRETDAAFDRKYGKGKPAVDKAPKKKGKTGLSAKKLQLGGTVKKAQKGIKKYQTGGGVRPQTGIGDIPVSLAEGLAKRLNAPGGLLDRIRQRQQKNTKTPKTKSAKPAMRPMKKGGKMSKKK